ncbi:MAG: MFS transporter [Burkholderiaceae bacterium]|nr:MFS transporter [Burkholderiaceae bacterium]
MTTIVVVRKAGQVAIASDSLVTFGELRLSGDYEANEKIIKVGDSYIGLAGSTAHFSVVRRLLESTDHLELHSRDEVFDTFLRAHTQLKEKYFLNPKEDEDDPYESSQITAVIANPSGIFGVYSLREVFKFERFWGIGSGRNFALGAMHASYDRLRSARAIARVGVLAGTEFDKNSSGPIRAFSFGEKAGQ